MVTYICDRCHYETTRKSNFISHLNRKKPCPCIYSDCTIQDVAFKYDLKIKQIESQKIPNESHMIPKLEKKKNFKIKKFKKCPFCDKLFTLQTNLTRHLKKSCKIKQEHNIIENLLLEQDEREKKWEKEKELLFAKIDFLLTQISNTNHTTNTNSHNTTINQQNIILNNFGEENIEHLTDSFFKKLIEQGPIQSIPKLIEKTHFDKTHPENKNLKITNKKEPYIHVYKNRKWQLSDKKETIKKLIDKNFFTIDDKYETTIKNKLSNQKKKIYTNYRDKMEEEQHPEVKKKTELVLLNNSQE